MIANDKDGYPLAFNPPPCASRCTGPRICERGDEAMGVQEFCGVPDLFDGLALTIHSHWFWHACVHAQGFDVRALFPFSTCCAGSAAILTGSERGGTTVMFVPVSGRLHASRADAFLKDVVLRIKISRRSHFAPCHTEIYPSILKEGDSALFFSRKIQWTVLEDITDLALNCWIMYSFFCQERCPSCHTLPHGNPCPNVCPSLWAF